MSKMSEALKLKAVAKSRAAIKENPAFKSIKMKPKSKKDEMLPKGKGSACSIEMQDIGKE